MVRYDKCLKFLTNEVMKLKNIIKVLRKKLGITQETLAKECGVVRQTINCIENDKYDPTLEVAFKIAKVLNRKVDEVFIYE
ncbi:putative transcriptional regulator [Schinkia azotoformans MEV2011]|uniref:Putative transcriptional regulator n=1 Tax=Schinkia azotoformans MEV2011 TaxID=1348973 RepID=A0A072NM28_SCHAZ|nr:putative transcriptional regulator [Schinkia azotoformans MEV2011]